MAESQREREREIAVCAPVKIIELLCNTSLSVLVLVLLIFQVRHVSSDLAQQIAGTMTKKKEDHNRFTTSYIHQNVNYGY